jgi:hypothetical protein
MSGTLSIDPDGFEDMDIHYVVKDLLISDINPYSKFYVATPFLDGTILFENNTSIIDNKLKSTNRLFIEHIMVGDKTGTKGEYELPIKLAVSILRDPKGNIDFDIPVEGDLADPSFKIGKVVWQIFKNLIIKAATAPYKLIANAFGGNEEDYKEIRYQYLQHGLTAEQSGTLANLVKLLKEKPDLGIEFVQFNNKEDEKHQLALFKTKKQFLGFSQDTLTDTQFQQVMSLSNKDSVFVTWVDSALGTSLPLTSIQEKCVQHIGNPILISEVDSIMEQRNSILLNYFTDQEISAGRIKISNVKDDSQAAKESIPRYVINLFSFESTSTGSDVLNDVKQ